jgi:hypothetical protein
VKKKILVIAFVLVIAALMIAPVLADPTNGQKKAVTVIMTRNDGGGPGIPLSPNVVTGPVIHLHRLQGYDVTIVFDDGTPDLVGTVLVERKMANVKGGHRIILTDNYVFAFVSEGGGFEGNGQVLLDRVNGASLAWGLFHGTGAFEGQTLNIGHGWEAFSSTPNPWIGYWLKYQA